MRSRATRVLDAPEASLLDLLDHVLTKGVMANGDVTLGVAGVDLIYLRLSALLCCDRSRDAAIRRGGAGRGGEEAVEDTSPRRSGNRRCDARAARSRPSPVTDAELRQLRRELERRLNRPGQPHRDRAREAGRSARPRGGTPNQRTCRSRSLSSC